MKKYLIGFALFALYFVVMRNIENKVTAVQRLTNVGA